jgi:hypothetical protein
LDPIHQFVLSSPDLLAYLNSDTVLGLWPQGVTVLIGALSIARLARVAGVDTVLKMMGAYHEPLVQMRKRQRRRKGTGMQRMRELSKESASDSDKGPDWTHGEEEEELGEDELEMRMTLGTVLKQKAFLQEDTEGSSGKYLGFLASQGQDR